MQAISSLIEAGRLEIKIAFRPQGIAHSKIGIIEDIEINKIAFDGSNNETAAAWQPHLNAEVSQLSNHGMKIFHHIFYLLKINSMIYGWVKQNILKFIILMMQTKKMS